MFFCLVFLLSLSLGGRIYVKKSKVVFHSIIGLDG